MTKEELQWVKGKIEDYIECSDKSELSEDDKKYARSILTELGSDYKSPKLSAER